MPIRTYLNDEAAFEPTAVAAMSQALEQTCHALNIKPSQAGDREVIARRIIDLASTGVVDAKALRNRVLQEARMRE
jgi:hypothetical protein